MLDSGAAISSRNSGPETCGMRRVQTQILWYSNPHTTGLNSDSACSRARARAGPRGVANLGTVSSPGKKGAFKEVRPEIAIGTVPMGISGLTSLKARRTD